MDGEEIQSDRSPCQAQPVAEEFVKFFDLTVMRWAFYRFRILELEWSCLLCVCRARNGKEGRREEGKERSSVTHAAVVNKNQRAACAASFLPFFFVALCSSSTLFLSEDHAASHTYVSRVA